MLAINESLIDRNGQAQPRMSQTVYFDATDPVNACMNKLSKPVLTKRRLSLRPPTGFPNES